LLTRLDQEPDKHLPILVIMKNGELPRAT